MSKTESPRSTLRAEPFNSLMCEVQSRMAAMFEGHRVYLNPREAADFLGVSERTLYELTAPRGSIPIVRVGNRLVKYDRADLIAFMDSAKIHPQADTPETPNSLAS